jgi:hypothetical protein
MDMNGLEQELKVYKERLPELLKDEGKFVLIFKKDVLGTFSAYDDALKYGYEKAGLDPFLVKKISGTETIAYFTRDVNCHM